MTARRLAPSEYKRLGLVIVDQLRTQEALINSCILTAKVTIEALRQMKIDAFELPVSAAVMNKVLTDWSQAHQRFPVAGTDEYPETGYGVGIGIGSEALSDGKGWNGHLVVIAERRWLLDFSLQQANRPTRGIMIEEPVVIEVDEQFIRSRGGLLTVSQDGVTVIYQTTPEKRAYRTAPDWTKPNDVKVTKAKATKV